MNDSDVYVTLAVSLNTTDDRTIVYTQNDDANDIEDAIGNQAVNDAGLTTIDAAAPVLTELRIEDTDNDGIIDQMTYVFSEIVFDLAGGITDEDIGTLRMPDNTFFDGGGGEQLGDANVSLTNDGTYGLLVMDVAAAGYTTVGTAAGSANAEGTPAANFDDDQGLVGAMMTEAIVDLAKPRIMSVAITGNSIADVNFSEPVWGDASNTTEVISSNFNFTIGGALTGPTVDGINATSEENPTPNILAGGETDIRVFFSYTGTAVGGETLTMNTDGGIYDDSNNTADATQFPTDNQDALSPPDIPNITIAEWLDQDSDGEIDGVAITFNTDYDIDEDGGGDGGDGLQCFVIRNGATVITQDGVDYDAINGNGFISAGVFFTLQFTGDPQPGTGIANLTLEYINDPGGNDRIESQSTTDDTPVGEVVTNGGRYDDGAEPFFGNFTATVLDNDADGNVDRIQIDAQDNINDSAIIPAQFTYNGVAATGVVNIDNTDQSFTLTVNGSGTAVQGDFVYTAGTLADSAANVSDDGTILAAAITDGAGPAILSAITADNNLNGQIDEITITFSEAFVDNSIDDTDFSLTDGYTIGGFAVSSPDITLTLDESGAADTYITPGVNVDVAGILEDAAGAGNGIASFTDTDDGAAPYITVTTQSAPDQTPDFSGTVDDPNASLIISVDGKTRSTDPPVTNNGDGTWNYVSASDGSPITLSSGLGLYEVTVIGIDLSGNNRTDVTSDEYDLTGGATITPATPANLCTSDGYQALGSIQITESANSDFSSSGTILLTLPSGFEFNTSAAPNTTGSSFTDIGVTFTFIGNATLRINVTHDGSDDGIDDLLINGLQVQAVLGGETGNLERTGGTASLLTSDTNYATLTSDPEPSAISSLDETTTTTTDITELSIISGTSFSLDATDQGPTTVNWYESVVDGSPEFVGTMATQANLNSAAGLHTYFVVNSDGNCESDPLTFNLMNYTYSDNGTNDFSSRTFRSTDDPDTMVFSRPAGHTVSVSGSGIVANISESTTLKAVFDPSTVAEGTYVITYSIENSLGETVSVTGSFTVEALSDLILEFRENGIVDAAPGEDFCETDVLSFDADIAEVLALSANSYFFRFSYFKTAGPGPSTLSPVAFDPVTGSNYPGLASQNNGTAAPQPWIIFGHNPSTDWDLDISDLTPGASYDIYLEYNRNSDGARAFRKVFSFMVQELPVVSIVDFGDLCENDNTNYQLEATVDGNTGFITNGFELEFDNSGSWIAAGTYADENLNPFNLQVSQGGSGPGQYRVIYETTPQGDGGCINSDTLEFTLFPTPGEPFLNATHNISWKGAPWVDGGDVVNDFDSYVIEYCSTSDINFIVGENSAIKYNWYDDSFNLLQGNQWFVSSAVAFDDPTTGGVTEVPTAGTETEIYFATLENGCESALKKITIYIYEDTELPEPDATYLAANGTEISTTRYVFDYCDAFVPIELNSLAASPGNPVSRNPSSRYNLYDEDATFISTINSSTINAADIGLGTGNQNFTFYISQLWNDQTPGAPGTALLPFEGCESELVQIDINVNLTPTDVTTADFDAGSLQYHVAEGNTLGNISHVSGLVEKYRWYTNPAPSGQVGADILDGEDMLEATLNGSGGFDPSSVAVANTNDVYSYYVTRIAGENAETGYVGCESTSPTTVNITVHAIQRAPSVASDNSASDIDTDSFIDLNSDGDGGNDDTGVDFYFSICNDRLESDLLFAATEPLYAGSSREFRWYVSDASQVRGALKSTNTNATFSELGLAGLNPPSTIQRYFEVIQVTDNDVFAGTESESTFIRVDISPQDALTFLDNSGDAISDSYCRDETPGNIIFDLRAGGVSAGNANVDYEIDSYLKSTYDANGTPEVDGGIVAGNPTIDLDALHDAVTGTSAIGGESTVHVIKMTYLDPSTLCEGSATKTITIHPDPDITFLVNGTDIAAFVTGDEQFCYEDGGISLQGALVDGTPLTGGSFNSSVLGGLTTNNGGASFNTINEHNGFHSVAGTAGKFLNQSTITITYNYTDAFGCDNSVNTVLNVNPEPEVLAVTGLASSDLAAARTTNNIRLTNFCRDATAVDVELKIIDPLEADPGSTEEDDYTGYSFDWNINGNVFNETSVNTLNYTLDTDETSLVITVEVKDANGCKETFNETHSLQNLPTLNITGTQNFDASNPNSESSFCVDGTAPVIGLTDSRVDGDGNTNTVDASDVVSWSVDSYSDDNTTPVQIASGVGSLPSVDLDGWHTDVTLNAPGSLVGGPSTYHTITIEYQDPSREYQGIATECSNTVSETIAIHPEPDVTFTVNGVDINDAGFVDNFCYEDGNITLQGNFSGGNFVSSELGTLSQTSPGAANFNTVNEHNSFHNETGTNAKFLNQSSVDITYNYTDGFGCNNSITTTLFVNPEPEVLTITGLPASDLAATKANRIRIENFCRDASAVDLEIKLIDPTDADPGSLEEDDYSGYEFIWNINGNVDTVDNVNTVNYVLGNEEVNLVMSVTVNDVNGCEEVFNETHSLQNLPSLNITGVQDFTAVGSNNESSFCVDGSTPTLGLTDSRVDGNGNTHIVDVSNITSWSVDSYSDDNTTPVQIASGVGSLPSVDLADWHTDPALNAPGSLVGGPSTYHTITINYQDPSREYQGIATECSNSVSETIKINPDPDITFTLNGVDADNEQFCYDDAGIVLKGISAEDGSSLGGAFNINGSPVSTNNGEAVIDADTYHGTDPFAVQSTHTVSYSFTNSNGCDRVITRSFLVNPRPRFVDNEIKTASTCATSDIELFVDMVDGVSNYSFTWTVNGQVVDGTTLNDEDGNLNDENLTYDMQGQSSANFGVTATYIGAGFTTNCEASITNQNITVGQEPDPAITWVGITAGNSLGTEFVITEDNATLPDADVNLVQLYIDGVLVVNETKNNPGDPNIVPINLTHHFDTPGDKSIELIMNTVANCGITETRTVKILPHYENYDTDNAYVENFETASSFDLTAAQGGWLIETRALDGKSETLTTTWTRGTSIPGTTVPENGSGAVYTNQYQDSEISFVYSPSFDLTGFGAPTVSMLRYKDFDSFRDGVALQISYDDGRNWITVGSYNAALAAEGLASTPGWYDREAITAAPGTQAIASEVADNDEGYGWAVNDETDIWTEAISPVPSASQYVRFRFALAAQAGEKFNNGFGFDLFEIYDRDQIVLVELFSSTLEDNSIAFNNDIDANPNFTGTDLLIINYFTDFANGAEKDQLNGRNTKDPGAKSSFYGIADVPSIAISGEAQLVSDLDDPETELEARLDNSKLENPAFDISLTASVDANNNLEVSANYTATAAFTNTNKLGLFIAIVEPQITLTEQMGNYPAGSTINNVLRKMLPSAAGQFVQRQIDVGDVISIQNQEWSINNMFTPDNFRVIAYVQNLNTKKVYQAADTLLAGGSNVLGLENELLDISLYPNPADKEVTVEFANPIIDNTSWVIYDQAGREVLKGELDKGTKTMTVQTEDMPSGLYFIHLYAEDRKRQGKRILIVH